MKYFLFFLMIGSASAATPPGFRYATPTCDLVAGGKVTVIFAKPAFGILLEYNSPTGDSLKDTRECRDGTLLFLDVDMLDGGVLLRRLLGFTAKVVVQQRIGIATDIDFPLLRQR